MFAFNIRLEESDISQYIYHVNGTCTTLVQVYCFKYKFARKLLSSFVIGVLPNIEHLNVYCQRFSFKKVLKTLISKKLYRYHDGCSK